MTNGNQAQDQDVNKDGKTKEEEQAQREKEIQEAKLLVSKATEEEETYVKGLTSELEVWNQIKEAGKELVKVLRDTDEQRKDIIIEFADKISKIHGVVPKHIARIIVRLLREEQYEIQPTYIYRILKENRPEFRNQTIADASSIVRQKMRNDGWDSNVHKYVTGTNFEIAFVPTYAKDTLVRIVQDVWKWYTDLKKENTELKNHNSELETAYTQLRKKLQTIDE